MATGSATCCGRSFPAELYAVRPGATSRGRCLAAVNLETTILNLLLFMIIAVAGFGILAIFYMIVVEKTRDIGILKSLGAPSRGIMGIFLAYGLGAGLVGSGVGMVLGLLFVAYINEIADGLATITGQQVFDPTVYYFQEIPTIVQPFTVAWIVVGAMLIAVLASILPARRAARLHPVEALRTNVDATFSAPENSFQRTRLTEASYEVTDPCTSSCFAGDICERGGSRWRRLSASRWAWRR